VSLYGGFLYQLSEYLYRFSRKILLHGLSHITCKIKTKTNFFTLQAAKSLARGNFGCDYVLLGQHYSITYNYSCDKKYK
jgi:hypothetical protein